MLKNAKLIEFFFEMLNTIKLYHWRTTSYAEHKATDELYEHLGEHIDKFVEVLLGKQIPIRIDYPKTTAAIYDLKTKEALIKKLRSYNKVLSSFNEYLDPNEDTDLLNIRDEMLGDINKTIYLLSFK